MSGEKPQLYLFVWTEFCTDFTDGLAFAIAETVEQAQRLIERTRGCAVSDWGRVQQFPASEPIAFCVTGGA